MVHRGRVAPAQHWEDRMIYCNQRAAEQVAEQMNHGRVPSEQRLGAFVPFLPDGEWGWIIRFLPYDRDETGKVIGYK